MPLGECFALGGRYQWGRVGLANRQGRSIRARMLRPYYPATVTVMVVESRLQPVLGGDIRLKPNEAMPDPSGFQLAGAGVGVLATAESLRRERSSR